MQPKTIATAWLLGLGLLACAKSGATTDAGLDGGFDAGYGTVIDAGPSGIDVACGRGALRALRLQLAGRKPMTAAEILNSQRLAGASFSSP